MPSVTDLMERLADDVQAQRVLCLLAKHPTNNKPGDKTLISVERELLRGLPSRAHVQNMEANGAYGRMLRDVARYGRVDMYTHQMEPCKLRDLFEQDGVTRAVVISLGHDRLHLQRYLAIHWTGRVLSPVDKAAREIAIELRLDLAAKGRLDD